MKLMCGWHTDLVIRNNHILDKAYNSVGMIGYSQWKFRQRQARPFKMASDDTLEVDWQEDLPDVGESPDSPDWTCSHLGRS